MAKKRFRTHTEYVNYIEQVLAIQDGIKLPRWRRHRRWLWHMPIARLKSRVNRSETIYYAEKFGYVRNEDVYEIDNKCVGAICTVVILAWGGLSTGKIAKATRLPTWTVKTILKNYKYYVGWHNAYTEDGRRIWPAIREVVLIHKDMTGEDVPEARLDRIKM